MNKASAYFSKSAKRQPVKAYEGDIRKLFPPAVIFPQILPTGWELFQLNLGIFTHFSAQVLYLPL